MIDWLLCDGLIVVYDIECDGVFLECMLYVLIEVGYMVGQVWLYVLFVEFVCEFLVFGVGFVFLLLFDVEDVCYQFELCIVWFDVECEWLEVLCVIVQVDQVLCLFLLQNEYVFVLFNVEFDWVCSVVEYLKIGVLCWVDG